MDEWKIDKKIILKHKLLRTYGYDVYLFYVEAGNEVSLAKEINSRYDTILALPICKTAHKSTNGIKTHENTVIIPSVVFVYVMDGESVYNLVLDKYPFKITELLTKNGKLYGPKLDIANIIFKYNGLIGLSKAKMVDGLIEIIEGPLYKIQDKIIKYDRRNRGCRVRYTVDNKEYCFWLAFEYVS